MFGDDAGYISTEKNENSMQHNDKIDKEVQDVLDASFLRVKELLLSKERALRDLAHNLYWYDYMDENEMEQVISGRKLKKEKVRTWEGDKSTFNF